MGTAYIYQSLFGGGVDHQPNHDHLDAYGVCQRGRGRARRGLEAFVCGLIWSALHETCCRDVVGQYEITNPP